MKEKNKQTSLLWIFENLNIYGMPFSIRYKNKMTYTSKIGIILSIITILSISALIFYYFYQLITHSSFTVLLCNDKSKLHSINLSNIPIMFSFLDLNSNLFLINQDIFSLSVWMKNFSSIHNDFNVNQNNNNDITINNNNNYHIHYSRIELELCENSIYKTKYPDMKKYDLSKFLCIKPNQKIELSGRHGDLIKGFKSLNIFFGYNENLVRNNLTNNLTLYKDFNKVINGSYLSIIYLSDVIDHYSYKNPIYQDFRNEIFQISKFYFKSFVYFFSSLTYMSDNGIFFNKYKNFTSFIFDHLNLDFVEKNNSESKMSFDNENYTIILKISYTCADYPITYYRHYLKIQNIFSNIGGCIDFVFIIFNYITIYFARKNLVVDITDNLVCHFCIDDCSKNLNKISKFINNENSNKDFLFNSTLHRRSLNLNNVHNYNLNKNINHNFSILNDNTSNRINNRKISNSNIMRYNSKLTKFLNEKNYTPYQKLKINYFDYLIPYFCLRKYKKYDLLCAYTDIMYSYLSLEEILPSIEKISKLFKEKKNDLLLKTTIKNIFTYRKNEKEFLSLKNK